MMLGAGCTAAFDGQMASSSADLFNSYCGYVRVCERDFAVCFVPAGPSTPARVDGCKSLWAAMSGHESTLQQRISKCVAVGEFLVELRNLLERLLRELPPPTQRPEAAFYELLMEEVDAVGWSSLVNISESLEELELEILDEAGRTHALRLSLPPDYPRSPPKADAALPAPFELQWPADRSGQARHSLQAVIQQFRAALSKHQLFWDILDDLDAHTWVLEPQNPTRDCDVRRLAIGQHCSMQLTLHVGAPTTLPTLQFLGAEKLLQQHRRALNARLGLWNPARSVRANLEDVLDLKFPTQQQASSEGADDYSVECAVCYMYELDGCVPEVACDGCKKPFHQSCLGEWLRALPTTRQSFNRLFGECPYCARPITVEAN